MFVYSRKPAECQPFKKRNKGYHTLLGRTCDARFFKNKSNPAFQSMQKHQVLG
ncbi:hypothetical protein BSF_05760 [Bacillus subtilis]|nr:hypothetical protein BSF_05760 [Bacillus subtilis]